MLEVDPVGGGAALGAVLDRACFGLVAVAYDRERHAPLPLSADALRLHPLHAGLAARILQRAALPLEDGCAQKASFVKRLVAESGLHPSLYVVGLRLRRQQHRGDGGELLVARERLDGLECKHARDVSLCDLFPILAVADGRGRLSTLSVIISGEDGRLGVSHIYTVCHVH